MKPGRLIAFKWIDGDVRPDPSDMGIPISTNPRQRLRGIAAERGVSLAKLSRVIGRNPTYLQQFITKGSPRRLPEDERRHLAIYLDIDERELGARDPWTPCYRSGDDTGSGALGGSSRR